MKIKTNFSIFKFDIFFINIIHNKVIKFVVIVADDWVHSNNQIFGLYKGLFFASSMFSIWIRLWDAMVLKIYR